MIDDRNSTGPRGSVPLRYLAFVLVRVGGRQPRPRLGCGGRPPPPPTPPPRLPPRSLAFFLAGGGGGQPGPRLGGGGRLTAAEPRRRLVTALFCDLVGST